MRGHIRNVFVRYRQENPQTQKCVADAPYRVVESLFKYEEKCCDAIIKQTHNTLRKRILNMEKQDRRSIRRHVGTTDVDEEKVPTSGDGKQG